MDAIRRIGAEVTHIHTVGNGVSDLLVSFRQRWYVLEVKDGDKPPSQRDLTEDERKWINKQRAPVFIVNNPQDAVEILCRTRP